MPLGPDGRPEQCVIVTTASARNVRGVDFETFQARTPHGVAGATARAKPALPGPIYFNENVIPDRSRTATSGDGGIIWTEVPAGTYRVITESPSTRFASFLATCEPGRIVNANPPWGAYELSPGEQPLGAGIVAGSVERVGKADGEGRTPAGVDRASNAAEPLRLQADAAPGRPPGRASDVDTELAVGSDTIRDPGRRLGSARALAKLTIKLTDAAGDSVTERLRLRLPRRGERPRRRRRRAPRAARGGPRAPDYVAYHDDEWGRPVTDDRGIYERLTLEAFQSGLSWLTILRKRENFRAAFDGFDFERVAELRRARGRAPARRRRHRPQPGQDRGGDRQRPRGPRAGRGRRVAGGARLVVPARARARARGPATTSRRPPPSRRRSRRSSRRGAFASSARPPPTR